MKKIYITIILLTFCFVVVSQNNPIIEKINVKVDEDKINASEFADERNKYVNKTEQPLYVLNSKIISYEELSKINNKFINKINILKNKKAIDKYGKNAKYGVIEITSRKK